MAPTPLFMYSCVYQNSLAYAASTPLLPPPDTPNNDSRSSSLSWKRSRDSMRFQQTHVWFLQSVHFSKMCRKFRNHFWFHPECFCPGWCGIQRFVPPSTTGVCCISGVFPLPSSVVVMMTQCVWEGRSLSCIQTSTLDTSGQSHST